MALSVGESIEDVLEDLELHRAILQSLEEQRPDAVEERIEALDVIKGLETKLAELRGSDALSSPGRSFPSGSGAITTRALPDAELDGPISSRDASPIQFRPPALSSLPSRPRTDIPSEMPRARKRQIPDSDSDSDDVVLPSSKRTATKRAAPAANQLSTSNSSSSSDSSGSSNSDGSSATVDNDTDDTDDLLRIFGFGGEDNLRALQEEQRKAEKWLEERKEQERRDAEIARSMMDSFDSAQPSTSSSAAVPGPSFYVRTSGFQAPEIHPRDTPQLSHLPQPSQVNTVFAGTIPAIPGNPAESRSNYRGPLFPSARPGADTDDSDISEITPGEFQRRTGINPIESRRPHPMTSHHVVGWPSAGAHGPAHIDIRGSDISPSTIRTFVPARMKGISEFIDNVVDIWQGDSDDDRDPRVDPKQVNQEIKQLLETIRPDAEISMEDREGTPEALKYTLLKHQKLGLAWMKSKEECEQKGGILADDMGLGKTVQAISLIVSRPSTEPERKTTLVIAPVALMDQWRREIKRMLRPGKHQLSVFVLHGERRVTTFRDLKQYDVVLTTFGTLASELKRVEKYDELIKAGGEEPTLTRQYLKSLPCLGPTSKWYRVIVDEAQCIKNRKAKAAIACSRLNTTYRWCMTGTPMMNNVQELHSLLKFLRIRPYASRETFDRDFTRPLNGNIPSQREKAMIQLRVLLKAVLLRRTKLSQIDGEPILRNLPPRVTERVHAAFSDDELEFYRSLEKQTQLRVNRYMEAGTVGRNYSHILVLLLRLRQACCHPHLIKDFSIKIYENTSGLDLVANAKAFSKEVVIRLRDNDDLECPICLDAVDNPIIFFPCGHSTCAECFSRISDPSLSLRQGIDGAVEVKCPTCRGAVDPGKITDHLSFRKAHFPELSLDSASSEALKSATQKDEDDDDDDSGDESSDESLSRFIVDDTDDGRSSKKSKAKGKRPARPKKTLAELKKEASKNKALKRKYLRRLEKTWISSAKIEKTMEVLGTIQQGAGGEKTIIFSQFTSLLDLLEVPIAREGFQYRRYDGSMKPADRNSAVLDFTEDPDCTVMLASLKAGNAGLNLVAASHVVIFDPFWNPYIEEQAIDRAHRIGQQREVHVHRILVPDTVEDRILALQDKKRELIEGALDENASQSIARLSRRELAYLFGIKS